MGGDTLGGAACVPMQARYAHVEALARAGRTRMSLLDPGQHTDEILGECGYSEAEIDALKATGVVAALERATATSA